MKKDLLSAVVVVAIIFGLCAYVGSIRADLPPTPSQPFTSTKVAAKAAANDRVIMHVNGEPVTESEFAIFLQSIPPNEKQFFSMPEGRMKLAEQVATLKALEQEGRRLGIDNEKNLRAELSLTEAQVVAVATLRKLAEPDPARLRAEYEKEKGKYGTIALSHIVVAYAGGAIPPRTGGQPLPMPQAMQKAQAILQRLRGRADFAQMAREISDDAQTAPNGGAIGDVPTSQLPPEVVNLKPGEISNPVQTQIGVHLFRVGERHTAPFETVREQLTQDLRKKSSEEVLQRLRKSVKVELDQKFFPRTTLGPPS